MANSLSSASGTSIVKVSDADARRTNIVILYEMSGVGNGDKHGKGIGRVALRLFLEWTRKKG